VLRGPVCVLAGSSSGTLMVADAAQLFLPAAASQNEFDARMDASL